jgi:hypothetical protein
MSEMRLSTHEVGAASKRLHMRRNLLDITAPAHVPTLDLADQRHERQQVVCADKCAARSSLGPSVRRIYVGPLRRQRAQPSQGVEEHHTVLTPVLLARGQHQALTLPGMEGVRDFNLYGCAAR